MQYYDVAKSVVMLPTHERMQVVTFLGLLSIRGYRRMRAMQIETVSSESRHLLSMYDEARVINRK
jgi:hypothetical protein